MKTVTLVGILLIILGVLGLVYGGITYTSKRETVKFGPLEATIKEEKTIPLPPILGGLALAVGVVLVLAGKRNKP